MSAERSVNIHEHVDAVKRLANQFRSLGALADFLEDTRSLEQHAREVEARADTARAAQADADARLAATTAAVAAAAERVAEAHADAERIVAEATAQAKAHLDDHHAAHAVHVQQAEAAQVALEEGVKLREQQLVEATAAVEAKQQELAALERKLAAVKAHAASLAGL